MRIALLVCLVLNTSVFAQNAPAPPATKPSTAPSKPIDIVAEKDKLKELIGQDVTVRGKVVEVFVSNRTGITILNFFPGAQRRSFNVVIDKANLESVNSGHGGDVAAAVKDQTVLVTGTVADYRDNPQIKVDKPEQIKIEPAKKE